MLRLIGRVVVVTHETASMMPQQKKYRSQTNIPTGCMYFHCPLFIHAPSIECLQAMAQVEQKVHAYMLLIGKLDKSLITVSKSSMFTQSSPTFAYHRTSPDWKAACLFSITPKLSEEVAHDLDSDLPGMSKFTHGIKKGDKARGVRIYSAYRFHKPEKSTMIDLDALQDIQSKAPQVGGETLGPRFEKGL